MPEIRETTDTIEIGKSAEQYAQSYLQQQGLKPLEQNYRCRYGEIDLIMMEGQTIVFVEVRYRKQDDYGSGAETITRSKQNKILKSASQYLLERFDSVELPCRVDVISINDSLSEPLWLKSAIEKQY